MLETVCRWSVGKSKPLALHAQMAHAPAVLRAYVGFRDAIDTHGTFPPAVKAAVMLAVSGAMDNAYAQTINAMLAQRAGWSARDVVEIGAGQFDRDARLSALLAIAREAAASNGSVSDVRWMAARQSGWADAELAELFVYIGLTTYVVGFVNYAGAEE
jgi:Carboxymuconolactone decarboxylase family